MWNLFHIISNVFFCVCVLLTTSTTVLLHVPIKIPTSDNLSLYVACVCVCCLWYPLIYIYIKFPFKNQHKKKTPKRYAWSKCSPQKSEQFRFCWQSVLRMCACSDGIEHASKITKDLPWCFVLWIFNTAYEKTNQSCFVWNCFDFVLFHMVTATDYSIIRRGMGRRRRRKTKYHTCIAGTVYVELRSRRNEHKKIQIETERNKFEYQIKLFWFSNKLDTGS